MKFEADLAGSREANGTYIATNEYQNDKPVFRNANGVFLSFNPIVAQYEGSSKPVWGSGWGIRKRKEGGTLYGVPVDSGLPPMTGWRYEFPGELGLGGSPPAPVLRPAAPLEQMMGNIGQKRTVIETQERAWKARKFCDAHIVCEGVRIPVHRGTLAAASVVFEAAFSSCMAEGESCTYEVKHKSAAAVEAVIRYIYIGSLECQNGDLPDILDLALQYEIDGLGREAAQQMIQDVNASNIKLRLAALKLHSETKFVKEALEQILQTIGSDYNHELVLALV